MEILITVVNFSPFLLLCYQIYYAHAVFSSSCCSTHAQHMRDLCLHLFPLAEGANAISEFVTEKNMLFTDVQFHLVFGIAEIFREKNKLSQP